MYTDMGVTKGTEGMLQANDAKPHVHQPSLGSRTHGSQHEVVIGVMGATGSGKSSFIKLLTGNDSVAVGDNLNSETTEVQVVPYIDPASGCKVALVDTPGFDDSREGMTDTEILKRITRYLLDAYDENRKLNGLIFVQRISDPRFSGQSTCNLRMFRNLCGENQYKNVVVLTTFWDAVADADGKRREAQLMSKYFKDLVQGSARFMQHDGQSHRSAQAVLEYIFKLDPTYMKIQEEIRLQGLKLEDTAAGSVHRQEVEALILKHKNEVDALKAEIDNVRRTNAEFARELKEERDKLQRKLKKGENEWAELKEGLYEGRKAILQLMVDAETERRNHEKWCDDNERAWQDHFDSQAKARALRTEIGDVKKTDVGLAQELREERNEMQRKLEKWENERAELKKRLDECKKVVVKLMIDAETKRRNHEKSCNDNERVWQDRLNSQAKAHVLKARINDVKKTDVGFAQEVREEQNKLQKWENKRAELKKRLDKGKKVVVQLMIDAETERRNHEKRRNDNERAWQDRLDSQAKAHTLKAEVEKINVDFAQELRKERDELQRRLKKGENESAKLKEGLHKGKKAILQLIVNAETERRNHEKWFDGNEHAWQDRLNSQAKAHALIDEIEDVKKTNVDIAQEVREERDELQRKPEKWENERAELKKRLDEGKKVIVQLMIDTETERKNHEKWRNDNERAWQDRLDSQAKALKEDMTSSLNARAEV